MRICEPELNLFEECVHDPKSFARFQAMATPVQREARDYFATIQRKNYFFWLDPLNINNTWLGPLFSSC